MDPTPSPGKDNLNLTNVHLKKRGIVLAKTKKVPWDTGISFGFMTLVHGGHPKSPRKTR